MLIGVDFDNTIVCYDELFHKVALERGLIPAEVPAVKDQVRDHLRRTGVEDAWTELQGYVYGEAMKDARPFPGVLEFFSLCRKRGIFVRIISHKTRRPFLGPAYDLHEAAFRWIEENGFYDAQGPGLSKEQVHFEENKDAKLDRIAAAGCAIFIDDLPEFLEEARFPRGVGRILFDPNGNRQPPRGVLRAGSWGQIRAALLSDRPLSSDAAMPVLLNSAVAPVDKAAGAPPAELARSASEFILESREFKEAAAKLISGAGFSGDFTLSFLPGAANNKVFRVDSGGSRALLKAYFQYEGDPRDRLAVEFSFSTFLWRHGVRALPQPLGCDPKNRLGLYEFVSGRRLLPGEVTGEVVGQALRFYQEVNRQKGRPDAATLPKASESCFSLSDHLRCVEHRLRRLDRLEVNSPLDRAAAAFVRDELEVAWASVSNAVRHGAREWGLDAELAAGDRCLSPSDFGFHNALLASDGRLKFIDFEYAGWDDPVKLICDFFCEQAVPVPWEHYQGFAQAVCADLSDPSAHLRRAALLLPVYRLKWCCILLNDFLPAGIARRVFARRGLDPEEQKAKQLEKVRLLLRQSRG